MIGLPRGHIGYVIQPASFAHESVQALERTRHGAMP